MPSLSKEIVLLDGETRVEVEYTATAIISATWDDPEEGGEVEISKITQVHPESDNPDITRQMEANESELTHIESCIGDTLRQDLDDYYAGVEADYAYDEWRDRTDR